eukprot:SAG31_NODE_667_length_12948_cov_70.090746_3_plen_123_part_00
MPCLTGEKRSAWTGTARSVSSATACSAKPSGPLAASIIWTVPLTRPTASHLHARSRHVYLVFLQHESWMSNYRASGLNAKALALVRIDLPAMQECGSKDHSLIVKSSAAEAKMDSVGCCVIA